MDCKAATFQNKNLETSTNMSAVLTVVYKLLLVVVFSLL